MKVVAALALVCVLGLGALCAALWVEHGRRTVLPPPTGPFAVGRSIQDWVDQVSVDSLAPAPHPPRELLVWLWYPAVKQPAAAADDYLPAAMRTEVERSRGFLLGKLLTRDLSKVRAHSRRDADPAPRPRSFPVLVVRGGASSAVWNYASLAQDLASHGYVVVGFDAPYRTGVVVFPDGRVVRRLPQNDPERVFGSPDSARQINRILAAWSRDIGFVLDRLRSLNDSDPSGRFTGRLDLDRVGVFGHSLGGAEAALFCQSDPRCRAGADVDGAPLGSVVQTGVPRPFMFLLTGWGGTDPATRRIEADIASAYSRVPPNARLRVVIRGAYHFGFSDDGALLKSHLVMRALRWLGVVRMNGRRQLAVTAYGLRRFFDAYLKGAGGARPVLESRSYPEITVLP